MLKPLMLLSFYLILFGISSSYGMDDFKEELFIRPLLSTHLYTYFQFTTHVNDEDSFAHAHLASRALGDIISRYRVQELHLTLTRGQWRHERWGYPVLDAAAGAELYAWFAPEVKDVDDNWRQLTSALAGMFCASLNFIENSNTVSPKMVLIPSGAVSDNKTHLRYATLPRENICTENLTPWKKLLPCISSGFAGLLNSREIHNTNYLSLGLHYRRICVKNDCAETNQEVKQTVGLVYDYDVLYGMNWTFRKLFGKDLDGACPLSSSSKIYVDVTSKDNPFSLVPLQDETITSLRGDSGMRLAIYHIYDQKLNLAAKYDTKPNLVEPIPPALHFNRLIFGHGREYGGIATEITNNHWESINVVLMENVPWWLAIRLSSLRVNGEAESKLILSWNFSLGRTRDRPYNLELLLSIPPKATTTVTIEFEFVFLKYREHPADPNHGFYLGSSLILANLPTAKNYSSLPVTGSSFDSIINATQMEYPALFRTNGALVSLPTPDFSMPFNVIVLACSVLILPFGPIHRLLTRKLVHVEIKPMTRKQRLRKLVPIFCYLAIYAGLVLYFD